MWNFTFSIITLFLIALPHSTRGQCLGEGHDTHKSTSWLSCFPGQNPNPAQGNGHWIQIDLGKTEIIDEIRIWNYNVLGSTNDGFNNFQIEFSLSGDNWNLLTSGTLTEASGTITEAPQIFNGFPNQYARYVLITAHSNHGGTCYGLSEIEIGIQENSICNNYSISAKAYNPGCPESTTGSIQVSTMNGLGPYNYTWGHGTGTSSLENLGSGVYSVTVADANGCQQGLSIELTDPVINTSAYHQIPIPTDQYYNTDPIHSSGIVAFNGQVGYSSESEVELQNEFEIVQGGVFTVSIEDCLGMSTAFLTTIETDTNHHYTNYIGKGQIADVQVLASDEDQESKAFNAVGGSGMSLDSAASSKFLSQATMGSGLEMIGQCQNMGISEWLDWQCGMTRQDFDSTFQMVLDCVYVDPGNGKIAFPYFRMAWWQNMLTGEDYLRDRIAFHLSQLFVVSDLSDLGNFGEGLASYYDMLHRHALGNFRDLLYNVTFHPSMGLYLSHLNNPKADTSLNQHPDENYAREVMQLFSIGLIELLPNGISKKNLYGNEIPTYSNDEVIEFSKVFTGLGFDHPMAIFGSRRFYDFTKPMIMYEQWHEPGPKYLLYGDTIPDGQTGLEDIDDAIDNLFHHPNVGPFFCRRMIQYLVTSNPSPDYLLRVVQTFEDNGLGVRGDMKSVIRAILTDPEARDCSYLESPGAGKLTEPMLRYLQLLRAFDVFSSDSTFYSTGGLFQQLTFQAPLGAPSVFNFFSPDYVPSGLPDGTFLRGPEFQILNSYTALGNYNIINSVKENNQVLQHETATIQLDLDDELILAQNPEALINRFDLLFTHGQLTQASKDIIVNAMNQLVSDEDKLEIALYLFMTSPEYVIGQ